MTDPMAMKRTCVNEDCPGEYPVPDLETLLHCTEVYCPVCGGEADIDVHDLIPYVAMLLQRVEWLEKCNPVKAVVHPLAGFGM